MSTVDTRSADAANPDAAARADTASSALRVVPARLRALPWVLSSFADGVGATPAERLACRYQILLARMPEATRWHLPDSDWAIVPVKPSASMVEAAVACTLDPDDPFLRPSGSPRAFSTKGDPAGFARFCQQYAALVRLSRRRDDADGNTRVRVTDPCVAERILQLSGAMADRYERRRLAAPDAKKNDGDPHAK